MLHEWDKDDAREQVPDSSKACHGCLQLIGLMHTLPSCAVMTNVNARACSLWGTMRRWRSFLPMRARRSTRWQACAGYGALNAALRILHTQVRYFQSLQPGAWPLRVP